MRKSRKSHLQPRTLSPLKFSPKSRTLHQPRALKDLHALSPSQLEGLRQRLRKYARTPSLKARSFHAQRISPAMKMPHSQEHLSPRSPQAMSPGMMTCHQPKESRSQTQGLHAQHQGQIRALSLALTPAGTRHSAIFSRSLTA